LFKPTELRGGVFSVNADRNALNMMTTLTSDDDFFDETMM
jgi:hypothetical protein